MSVPGGKKVQTCAQRIGGTGQERGEGSINEESVGRSEDRDQETESDCWRICVHLNPERKGDQFDSFFCVNLSDHNSVHCPLPAPLRPRRLCE